MINDSATLQSKPESSLKLTFAAAATTQKLVIGVVKKAWLPLLLLHVIQLFADQFFTYALDFIHERGREDLLFLGVIAALEMVFSLFWSSAWILVLAKASEAVLRDDDRIEGYFPLAVRYFNQLVVEQVRALAAVLWRVPLLLLPALVQYVRLTLLPFVVLFSEGYAQGRVDALQAARDLSRQRFMLLTLTVFLSFLIPWVFEQVVIAGASPWIWENPLGITIAAMVTLVVNTVMGIFLFSVFQRLSMMHPAQIPE